MGSIFDGVSPRLKHLMDPLALSPYVKNFGPQDKFYEMNLYRYYYDDVQVRVVRVEDPPPVPVRVNGDIDPDDGPMIE